MGAKTFRVWGGVGRNWDRELGCKEVGRGRTKPIRWGVRGGRWGVCGVSIMLSSWVTESGVPMPSLLPSLKLECEKLASEKTEMQRHYVMVRGLACQGSAEQGLALSENTWTVNPNSVCYSGVSLCPSQGLVFPPCKMGCSGFQALSPRTLPALENNERRMSPPLLGISEGPGSLGTATCPTSLERVEGGPCIPLGGVYQGLGQSVPCCDPPAWGLLEDPESPGAGLDIRQCRGHSRPAFPLQYYEMSYGLNVEMHKQVTVLGQRGSVGRAGVWKP